MPAIGRKQLYLSVLSAGFLGRCPSLLGSRVKPSRLFRRHLRALTLSPFEASPEGINPPAF